MKKPYRTHDEATADMFRNDPAFASLKIFRCPMTKNAFPGAPARSDWVQLAGPLHNPYFGTEMLDCGSEVETNNL